MKAKRAKPSQLFHGRQLHVVSVLFDPAQPWRYRASIKTTTCVGRPVRTALVKDALFVPTRRKSFFFPDSYFIGTRSLGDMNIVWNNHRNLHQAFVKLKDAQRYADRINAGCLTWHENRHRVHSLRAGNLY